MFVCLLQMCYEIVDPIATKLRRVVVRAPVGVVNTSGVGGPWGRSDISHLIAIKLQWWRVHLRR